MNATSPKPDQTTEFIAGLTPAQANDLFLAEVSRIERETGTDYATAFARAKLLNKRLFEQIGTDRVVTGSSVYTSKGGQMVLVEKDGKPVSLGNDSTPPIFGPQIKTLLGLPADADQTECEVAWRANGGTASPRKDEFIWRALSGLMEGRAGGKANALTKNQMAERYPLLAAALSKTTAAV
ncbi:MAG: hypothetical protein U1F65_05150 [Verrucomicrobiota bacterium]